VNIILNIATQFIKIISNKLITYLRKLIKSVESVVISVETSIVDIGCNASKYHYCEHQENSRESVPSTRHCLSALP